MLNCVFLYFNCVVLCIVCVDCVVCNVCVYMCTALLPAAINPIAVIKHIVSYQINVKVNFTLEQATKAQKGSRGIALLFL